MDFSGIFTHLLNVILSGGSQGLIALLVGIIILLILERKKLQDSLNKKEEKIEEVIDNYYKGNLSLTEALSSLKVLLSEIKSKL